MTLDETVSTSPNDGETDETVSTSVSTSPDSGETDETAGLKAATAKRTAKTAKTATAKLQGQGHQVKRAIGKVTRVSERGDDRPKSQSEATSQGTASCRARGTARSCRASGTAEAAKHKIQQEAAGLARPRRTSRHHDGGVFPGRLSCHGSPTKKVFPSQTRRDCRIKSCPRRYKEDPA